MSDRTELVRSYYLLMQDRRIDIASEFITEDFELDLSRRVLNPDTYSGVEGLQRFIGELDEIWEGFKFSPSGFEEIGERVLADVPTELVGRVGGVPMTATVFHVWTLEGDRASRLAVFTEREDAVAYAENG